MGQYFHVLYELYLHPVETHNHLRLIPLFVISEDTERFIVIRSRSRSISENSRDIRFIVNKKYISNLLS